MSSSTRNRKVLENLNNASEERTDVLEKQLTEAKLIAEEADKKYDEVKPRGLEARATSHPCFLCRKCLKVEVKKSVIFLVSSYEAGVGITIWFGITDG